MGTILGILLGFAAFVIFRCVTTGFYTVDQIERVGLPAGVDLHPQGPFPGPIARDPDVAGALFELLEAQRIVEGGANLTLVRAAAHPLLADLLSGEPGTAQTPARIPATTPKEPLPVFGQ